MQRFEPFKIALEARNAAVAALEKKFQILEAQQEREQEQELSRTKMHFVHVAHSHEEENGAHARMTATYLCHPTDQVCPKR